MAEILALIILIGSFLGMLVIFLRKIPILATLPPEIKEPQQGLVFRLKSRISRFRPVKSFSSEALLQKILSKIRVLNLKIEHRTSNYLQKMRENSRRKKVDENDNYWEELKKTSYRKPDDEDDLPS